MTACCLGVIIGVIGTMTGCTTKKFSMYEEAEQLLAAQSHEEYISPDMKVLDEINSNIPSIE